MPGPAHGAPPPTLRGRGFPTRSGQTRARARSHSGGGGGAHRPILRKGEAIHSRKPGPRSGKWIC